MLKTGAAFGWQLLGRHRWAAAALVLYGAAIAAAAHSPGALQWRATLFGLTIPLGSGLLLLLAAFTYPEGDIVGRQSSFPPSLMTLPVRSWELVLWPMLLGTAAAAGGWIAVAGLILAPLGVPAPAVWPAAMLAAMVACLQALLWAPMALPYA